MILLHCLILLRLCKTIPPPDNLFGRGAVYHVCPEKVRGVKLVIEFSVVLRIQCYLLFSSFFMIHTGYMERTRRGGNLGLLQPHLPASGSGQPEGGGPDHLHLSEALFPGTGPHWGGSDQLHNGRGTHHAGAVEEVLVQIFHSGEGNTGDQKNQAQLGAGVPQEIESCLKKCCPPGRGRCSSRG